MLHLISINITYIFYFIYIFSHSRENNFMLTSHVLQSESSESVKDLVSDELTNHGLILGGRDKQKNDLSPSWSLNFAVSVAAAMKDQERA